jgi:hypothetical protein
VHRGDDDRGEVGLEGPSALPREAKRAAHHGLGGGRPKQDDRVRAHELELLAQPRLAGLDLETLRRLVDAPAAALLELEVLDHVGDVDLGAYDADRLERAVELATGRSHEGPALAVLLVTGLLADHHHLGVPLPLAEHGLARAAPEVAAAAAGGRLAQCFEARSVR